VQKNPGFLILDSERRESKMRMIILVLFIFSCTTVFAGQSKDKQVVVPIKVSTTWSKIKELFE